AAEAWPARYRGRVSAYVGLGWQAGVLAAALAIPFLLPHLGWRGMFMVGVIPALAAWAIRKRLHEPEVFERNNSKQTGHTLIDSYRLLVKDKQTAKMSLGVAILCSVQNFGYYGIMIWMPSYLAKTQGFGLTKSATWTAVTILGMAFGIWAFGQLADRIGRKPSFLI